MAFNYEYPYTDAHRHNDDWLINKVKELALEWLKTSGEWTETQEAWGELKRYIMDYFNNLDVQEEINLKIDKMVSDGTFERLFVGALGYVTPEMFGAVGDGVTDDTTAIQSAIDSANTVFLSNKTYIVNDNIRLKSNLKITGNNACLKNNGTTLEIKALLFGDGLSNLKISGVKFETTGIRYGIWIINSTDFIIEKCEFATIKFGVYVYGVRDFTMRDLFFRQERTTASSSKDGIHINGYATNGLIANIRGTADDDLIALNADDSFENTGMGDITNITIDGVFTSNYQENGDSYATHSVIRLLSFGSVIDNIVIRNVVGYADYTSAIQIGEDGSNIKNITIDGCVFGNSETGLSQFPPIHITGNCENLKILNTTLVNKRTVLRPEHGIVKIEKEAIVDKLTFHNVIFDGNNISNVPAINVSGSVNILKILYCDLTKVYYCNPISVFGNVTELYVSNTNLKDKRYSIYIGADARVDSIFTDNVSHTMTSTNAVALMYILGQVSIITMNNCVLNGEGHLVSIQTAPSNMTISQNNCFTKNNTHAGSTTVHFGSGIGNTRFISGVKSALTPSVQKAGDSYVLIGDTVSQKFYNGVEWS